MKQVPFLAICSSTEHKYHYSVVVLFSESVSAVKSVILLDIKCSRISKLEVNTYTNY